MLYQRVFEYSAPLYHPSHGRFIFREVNRWKDSSNPWKDSYSQLVGFFFISFVLFLLFCYFYYTFIKLTL